MRINVGLGFCWKEEASSEDDVAAVEVTSDSDSDELVEVVCAGSVGTGPDTVADVVGTESVVTVCTGAFGTSLVDDLEAGEDSTGAA